MTEFDRLIAESLQRRAGSLPATPKSYVDVTRRVARRRRRVTSMTTAAVSVPALVAVGWAVTRPDPAPTVTGDAPGDTSSGDTITTDTTVSWPSDMRFRCFGDGRREGDYTYFDRCEAIVDITAIDPASTVVVPGSYPIVVTDTAVTTVTNGECLVVVDPSQSDTTMVISVTPADSVTPPSGTALEVTATTTVC